MIIGKTRYNLDFQLNNGFDIEKQRYYFISRFSRKCLLECNIDSLPVSLNLIIKHFKIKMVTYSSLKKLNIAQYKELINTNQGFSEKNNDGSYYIFYDDYIEPSIQRFTIAHEIGHILLKHFEKETKNTEKEANMFAARLLMPMAILKECKVKSIEEVKELCFVSMQAATYRFNRLQEVSARNKFYSDNNEKKLTKQFHSFIHQYLKLNK